MQIVKATSLETAKDINETLEWKINSLIEQDKNVSNGLCDYFGIALSNLDSQIAQLKEVESEIKARKQDITAQMTAIKQEGACFLESQGIDKLEGVLYSSISVKKGKEVSEKTKFKLLTDKKESEAFLVDAGLAVYECVSVPATKDSITVYSRKVHTGEIE